MSRSQGGEACYKGDANRRSIHDLLTGRERGELHHERGGWRRADAAAMELRDKRQRIHTTVPHARGLLVSKGIVCENLYGEPYRADFVLWRHDWPDGPLVLEVATQDSSGSASDKVALQVESLVRNCPFRSALLLIGEEFTTKRKGVARYAERRAKESARAGKLVRVWVGYDAFHSWVINEAMSLPPVTGLGFPAA